MISTLAQDTTGGNDVLLVAGFVLVGVTFFLLFLELLVPSGGLIGMLCGISAVASVIAFFKYDSTWGIISALAYLVLGPIVLVFIFKLWLHSPLGRRMILGGQVGGGDTDDVTDDDEAANLADQARRERLAQLQQLIGADGVTVTALRPVGVVKINGQRVDALAESGVIPADTEVLVTDVYDNQIKVRPK